MNITAPQGLTPTKLRIILSATLALIILAGAGVFYLAYDKLGESAAETGQHVASARASQDALEQLQKLRKDLESKSAVIDRVSRVTADSENYAYQDRLVNDLTIYANRANLSVKNISFSGQAAGNTGAAPVATEGGATPGAAPVGLKKATVDITLDSPVNYEDLLNFLHYVEQNLTKLKISKVVMTKSQESGVTIDVLNLEVHLR